MPEELLLPEAYDLLKLSGIYYIVGDIQEGDLTDIHQHMLMKTLTPDWNRPLYVFLNSVGGNCQEGWALIDLIELAKQNGNIVKTIGMGNVCSMATCILAAGSRGHRLVTRNCELLMHAPMIGHMEGNVHQIAETTLALKQEQVRHERFWLEYSRYRSIKQVRKHILGREDHWIGPEEAIEHGFVDAIAGALKLEEPKQSKKDKRSLPKRKKKSRS
tara:strand:+ start:11608 stop:12255 length:648 start_codon:yes stop_codon:yes gene_type:complete